VPPVDALTHAAGAAYSHGMARAAGVGVVVLVICAILCLIFLPGLPSSRPAE
jgi:hypothetical protein